MVRTATAGVSLLLGIVLVSPLLARRGAERWLEQPEASARAAGQGVRPFIVSSLDREEFTTGSALFDGEWLFGTYMMGGVGYAQSGLRFPRLAEEHAALADACIEGAVRDDVRSFQIERVGEDPLDPDARHHHAAYLGYLGVLLGLQRRLDPETRWAELHDQIAARLEEDLAASDIGLLQTYPGEVYPVDNLSVFATLALHERATGTQHPVLPRVLARLENDYVVDGLLVQAVSPDGQVVDGPRGSGTALGAYFLGFVDRNLSRELYEGTRRHLQRDLLGFGWVREYSDGATGRGDIDSGPIVLGAGVSATGFSLAGALLHDDLDHFRRVQALVRLWGAPSDDEGRLVYATGGPLGNALLFAMTTAHPSVSFGGAR